MAAAQFVSPSSEFTRTLVLLNAADASIRRRFLELTASARGLRSLEEIEQLVIQGRGFEALALMDDVGPGLNLAITAAYVSAGVSVSGVLRQQGALPLIQFDQLNTRGVFALQASGSRLIRQLQTQQAGAIAITLQDGVRAGLSTKRIARSLQGSLGLTAHQATFVGNYRRQLMTLNSGALTRALRDRRSDAVIRRAILAGNALSPARIDSLVSTYQDRLIRERARVIASTEALAAVNMGEAEMWSQAVDRGLDARIVEQEWHPAFKNTRETHADMAGQIRPLGQPFTSGGGISLRHPGDSSAPAREVIGCQCQVTRRFLESPL